MAVATAGNKAALFLTGASLVMTNEAMVEVNTTTFDVVNVAKNIWDWREPLILEEDVASVWTPVDASTYEFRQLFGRVVFNASATGRTFRISGRYLPKYTFALAREVSWEETHAELDVTTFGDESVRRIYGLADVTGSVQSLSLLDTPLDGVGGTQKELRELLKDREFVVLSYQPHEENPFTQRAVVMFTAQALSSSVDDLVEASLEFAGAAPKVLGGQVGVQYSA